MIAPRRPLPLLLALALAASACRRERHDARSVDGGDASPALTPSLALAPSADAITGASGYDAASPALVVAPAVDGAALRAAHGDRLRADKSPVIVEEGGTALELGKRLAEKVVPRRGADVPVLLKPNLGGFEWFRDPDKHGGDDGLRGRITDPEFVRGVVRGLRALGYRRITIAEGWGARHEDWLRLVRVSGYEAMAREEGVALVAMDDDGVFDREGDTPGKPVAVSGLEGTHVPTLLLPKILVDHLQHGLFLSLPKIKAHRFGVVSVGIKGMQGVVMLSDASPAFRQKWRMHRELGPALELGRRRDPGARAAYVAALEAFGERVVDVLELAAPDAVLAEGAPAMGGDGFSKQWPRAGTVAVGGTNAIAVDKVASQLLGLWDSDDLARELGGHRASPLVEIAARRSGLDLATVAVQGSGAALVGAKVERHYVSMAGFEIHDGPSPSVPPGGDGDGGVARPTLVARRAAAAPTIDGVVDAAWASAERARFDTDTSGASTGIETSVRAMWTDGALHVLFELDDAHLHVDTSKPVSEERAKLYEEDCVELFLTPDPKAPQRYAEVELGPRGHFLDLLVDREKRRYDVAWSSGLTVATRVDEAKHRAVIEASLRAEPIRSALAPGARLPLGLFRVEGKAPRRFLAWSPARTPKPDFHRPEAFGTLVLAP